MADLNQPNDQLASAETRTLAKQSSRGGCLRWLAIGLLVLSSPFLVFVIYNQIDEPPSALALRYAQPLPAISDADNAWLAFVGLGAAPDQDTLDWARQWVAAKQRGEDLDAPVAHVAASFERHGIGETCPHLVLECTRWARLARWGIAAVAADNALLLERYERALKLTGWHVPEQGFSDVPADGFQTANLHLDVLTMALVEALDARDPVAITAVLERLQTHTAFWSRIATRSDSFVGAVVAARQVERGQRMAGEITEHLRSAELARHADALEALLSLRTTDINWHGAMAREHRTIVAGLDTARPMNALREWRLKEAWMGLAYAPQATRNLHATSSKLSADLLAAAPEARAAPGALLQQFVDSVMPPLGDAREIPGYFAHNAVGKILVAIAIPAVLPYGDRIWDEEALRRMSLLKVRAALADLRPDEMPEFLWSQQQLVDPWTGEGFDWTSPSHQITGAARSKHWKSTHLQLPYRHQAAPGVYACPKQWGAALHIGDAPAAYFRSCGDGLEAVEMASADASSFADAPGDNVIVHLRGNDELLWLEALRRDDDGNWRRYEALLDPVNAATASLQPIGHDTPWDATASLLPPRRDHWLSVHQSQPKALRELVQDFDRALARSTAGIQQLTNDPIRIQAQSRADDLYALLAGDAGLAYDRRPGQQGVIRKPSH